MPDNRHIVNKPESMNHGNNQPHHLRHLGDTDHPRTVRYPRDPVRSAHGLNALIAESMSRQLDALLHHVTVRLKIMKTWIVIDNYRTHGLAFTVAQCQRSYRRRLGVNALTARSMALVTVRTVLSHAIDNGGL